MTYVTENQPTGTPTWIDLGIPDLDRAMGFYGAVFGWDFAIGAPETGHYTTCLVDDRPVAAIMPNTDPDATEFWWGVYLATEDCDGTLAKVTEAGGTVVVEAMDVMEQGRMAIVKDTVGAQFGLWQGRAHIGAQVVNQPNSLVRNDLVTPDAEPARRFYASVFDFTLDRNDDLPDFDFTFLRRRDGHEVAGIFGSPEAAKSSWGTTFEVADTDATIAKVIAAGGAAQEPQDMMYGRFAVITDPFGTEFSIIARPVEG